MNSSAAVHDPLSNALCRIGLLAFDEGLDDEANNIFRSQKRILADPYSIEVSRAIILIDKGRMLEAIPILRDVVLAREPEYSSARVMLGVALREAGLPGAQECFERVLATSVCPASRALAESALEAVETDNEI